MSKRQASILRGVKMKKRDAPSLGCMSGLSLSTGLTEGTGSSQRGDYRDCSLESMHTRDSCSTVSYESTCIDAQSTTTTTLMELMHDDNNAWRCDVADILGMDDASLASDHGLIDVKEDGYWFDEESDACDGSEYTEESGNDAKSEASTKISGDVPGEGGVAEASSEDSEDSLINGVMTINLRPKISAPRDQFYQDKETQLVPRTEESDGASVETESTLSIEKRQAQHADTMKTLSESASESVDERPSEECNLGLECSKSLEDTDCVVGRNNKILVVPVPTDGETFKHAESAHVEPSNQINEFSISKSLVKNQVSSEKKEYITSINKCNNALKSKAGSSNHLPPRKQSSGYISPRQWLAHKCLQDALRVIKREDAANASMSSASMSREELHSLTDTGCAMMLKKKEREEDDRRQQERECELELEEEITEREDDEQRDDRSTAYQDGNEERDSIELAEDVIIDSGSTVGATSLVSYIGTVAGTSINNSSSMESNEQPMDPPSSNSQDDQSKDSQYLHDDFDSTTGLSYIGTAVVQGTPLEDSTALNSKDRITDVPQFNSSCEKKKPREEEMDLIQVETSPTVDETISLDAAGSQSFGSGALTPKTSTTSDEDLHSTPSHDSINEKNDTLSPLPTKSKVFGRGCYSPARSYATSIAASSASTSVSDVFGMLRTSLNPNDEPESDDSSTGKSGGVMSERVLASHLQDTFSLTSDRGYNMSKKKRSKSMTSMHVPNGDDYGGLTLGNALMATNIFSPPRNRTKTIGSTPSSIGAAHIKRSEQSELQYGSIGATFSPLRFQQPSRPQSVVFGAVTSPTPSMFSSYTDIREIAEDIETNPTKQITSTTTPIKKEVFAIAEEMVDTGSETSSALLTEEAERGSKCGIGGSKRKTSDLQDYLDNNNGSTNLSADSEPAELYQRVQWLEKVLGVGRGGANRAFEDDLKQKLSIVEQRLEEEMELKSAANKTVYTLQAKLGSLNEEQLLVDRCLRNEVSSLKSQLEFEKIKSETAESDVKAALSSVLDLGLACEKKDKEIAELIKTNELSLKRQLQLESELVSCAEGNDALRSRVLALANDGATKDHTLSSALSQLNSLSSNIYNIQNQLDEEKRKSEQLQFSLDDVSLQMLDNSKKVRVLESENDALRSELKRLRAEKEQTQRMRRSARGF